MITKHKYKVKTNNSFLDKIFSNRKGIQSGQVSLITGEKDSLIPFSLSLSNKISKNQKVLYISLSRDINDIKDILKEKYETLHFTNHEILFDVLNYIEKEKYDLFVFDSISHLDFNRTLHKIFDYTDIEKRVLNSIIEFSKDTGVPSIILNQLNNNKWLINKSLTDIVDTHLIINNSICKVDFNKFGGLNSEFKVSNLDIQYIEEITDEELSTKLKQWKQTDPKHFDSNFISVCSKTFDFLITKYKHILKKKRINVTNPLLTLEVTDKKDSCITYPLQNKVYLSTKQLSELTENSTSSYENEKSIFEYYTNYSIHNMILYIIIHEFCHLLYYKHSTKFFETVALICEENSDILFN